MKAFVLLVTWIVSGQPPSSYQTTFSSAATCEVARNAVLADGQRLKAEFEQKALVATGDRQHAALISIGAPAVTAVCVAQ
jgi:hypothetical protein